MGPPIQYMARSPPPPPSRGRWNWEDAWREARAETAEDARLFAGVQQWVSLLRAEPSSSKYWANRELPPRQTINAGQYAGKAEWVSCPGRKRTWRSKNKDDHHACTMAFWPPGRCVTYVVGVGNEWGLTKTAIERGCVVHAYDPTIRLRRAHERRAAEFGGNVT